jgi:hypothetical protein
MSTCLHSEGRQTEGRAPRGPNFSPTRLAAFALLLLLPLAAHAGKPPATIPFSEIGAKATTSYQGDALGVTAAADGARLRCGFQKLEGHATAQGLWLESTTLGGAAGKLHLVATAIYRDGSRARQCALTGSLSSEIIAPTAVGGYTALARTGTVQVAERVVRFIRPRVTEEYSVSVDGVRQDFVIEHPPLTSQPSPLNPPPGQLRLELALSGARVEATAGGVTLRLEGSERALAYSRLRATDATGRQLKARLEALQPKAESREQKAEESRSSLGCTLRKSAPENGPTPGTPETPAPALVAVVEDAEAVYPLCIDPTFSDANWVSLSSFPGAASAVMAVVADDGGNLYFGGGFSVIGSVVAHCIAKWDGRAWSTLGSGMDSEVLALAVSGTNLYAGGYFTTAGGIRANYIAKWNGAAWSAMGSGMNNPVYALAAGGTNLYAGGDFTTAGEATVNYVAAWNGSAWSAMNSGMDGRVRALAVSNNNLYAGGGFSMAGGAAVNNVAKWDGNAWSALGSGMYNPVNALAVSGTSLYAAVGGSVAKWGGRAWSALGSGMGGDFPVVNALAVSGTNLYAGGAFTTAGGVPASRIAKWNGTAWSALGSGIGAGFDAVFALASSGTDLYAGGQFTTAGGVPAVNIAEWKGSAWSVLGSGMNDGVFALTAAETNLYVGGRFTMAGGLPANRVAKWDGRNWSTLGMGLNGDVWALAVSGSNLYAGGLFSTAGGVAANNIAKWDGHVWSALGSGIRGGPYDGVSALAVSGSDLYVGGYFTSAGGVGVNNIAKWNGTAWSPLGSGMNDTVLALAASGSNLYAGGFFTVAGVPANHIAKWDGNAWSALGSGMYPSVRALTVIGTDLYAGGMILISGGVAPPYTYVSKWDGGAWSDLPMLEAANPTSADVSALAVSGTDLYVAGTFTTTGGLPADNIAKWDGHTWSALGSGIANSSLRALAADGAGHLFVGGWFTMAGTIVSPYIVEAILEVRTPTILMIAPTQTAEAGAAVRLAVKAVGEPAPAYQWYFNGTNGLNGTSSNLLLSNILPSQSGTYTVVVINEAGAVTSAPVLLNVIPAVEHRRVPGVSLTGTTGSPLNLDYATSLNPLSAWSPLGSVSLSNPPQYYFDLTAPLPPQRFYRAWQTGPAGVVPSLALHLVPALTLTGGIGTSVRVDYINQYGPTNAWVTLDTVTLTNTSQLYFDTSSIGQPARLWRLVPLP